jgi:AcrR family transcriptional regulator
VDSVVTSSGVTKGAFYHHFANKERLFEAVFIEEQRRIVERLAETYGGKAERDPRKGFYDACRAYLEISIDPAVQRITLLDALGVLGWERMRKIESDYGLAMMKMAIGNALGARGGRPSEVDPLAHILFGAMSEAAMFLANAENPTAAKRQVERQFKRVLDCLLG